jgi:hypothetical protein
MHPMGTPLTDAQLRQQILDLVDRLLPGEGPVSIHASRSTIYTSISELPPAEDAPPPRVPSGLSPEQTTILRNLTTLPISSRRLANRCQLRYNAYFRRQLRLLRDAGLVRHTTDGYSRPHR